MGEPVFVVSPAGSQQQQPLQSVQDALAALGWHLGAQLASVAVLPPPVPVAAPPGLDEPPVEDDVEPPVPAPVLPPEPVVPPPVSLPHPMIPTVEEAPVTTKT
jgi:hypothetical protein